MKRKHTILLISIICFLLISTNLSLIANQSIESSTIELVSFQTYSSFYQNKDDNEEIEIIYPRSSIPAILTPTQSLSIQFQSIDFTQLIVTISTSFDPLKDIISLPIESLNNEQNVYNATVTIPENTPAELYNLTLTIETEKGLFSTTRPRAISIKDTISDSFTFVHLTDFHIGDPRGLTENPKEIFGWKASRKTVEEINLLNPDFVIISGDLTFGQLYPFEYRYEYPICYDILQEFTVPTYLCPGNHDGYIQTFQDGLKFWEEYFGPLYYSFNYNNTHILSVNSYDWPALARIGFSYLVFNWGGSFQKDQLKWIENDLENNVHADQTFIMLHHNPLWDTIKDSLVGNGYNNQDIILDLIRTKEIDAVFAGHVHRDNITEDNETLYVTTTTASSSVGDDGYWGYRIIRVENSEITEYNYQEPDKSIPSYQINVIDKQSHFITIENKLLTPITIQYEFIVPTKEYSVNNGEIVQIREKNELSAIYVSSTIDAETTETIMLL